VREFDIAGTLEKAKRELEQVAPLVE